MAGPGMSMGSLAFDEFGRPFLILKDEAQQDRMTGTEAIKSHIIAAKAVSQILKTSLGPKGLDKLMVSPDGDITITNDGATILQLLEVEHPAAKVLVELAALQDEEVGDGTTSVVIVAAELLKNADELVKQKIHPTSIISGYTLACKHACKFISVSQSFENTTS